MIMKHMEIKNEGPRWRGFAIRAGTNHLINTFAYIQYLNNEQEIQIS